MFTHKKCKQPITIDCSGTLSITSLFAVTSKGIVPSMLDIKRKNQKLSVSSFMCNHCETEVPVNDIECECERCGEVFPVKYMYKLDKVAVFVCERCRIFCDRKALPLAELLLKVNQ